MPQSPMTRALLFVEELRKLDPELPVQHAAILLLVAREEGISQVAVAQALDLSKSAISRAFDKLGSKGSALKAGLELIEVRDGLVDTRQRQAFLTAKGKRCLNTLMHLMEG